MNFLIFGAPGSGKGTQACQLAESMRGNLSVISLGDLLRAEVALGTEIGREIEESMLAGELVGDALVGEIILRQLRKVEAGFLLDGFPRNLQQAEFLTAVLKLLNKEISAVLKLDVDSAVLESRLQGRIVCAECGAVANIDLFQGVCSRCGSANCTRRDDDSPAVIKRRLLVYEKWVVELERYYHGKVVVIDGNKSVDEVRADIKRKVNCLNN